MSWRAQARRLYARVMWEGRQSLCTMTPPPCPPRAPPPLETPRFSAAGAREARQYQWCVVGAGPAGIAAVGVLLDSCVEPASVLWIDPAFSVGDFGTNWKNVSSNTTVALFLRFCAHCRSFEFPSAPAPAPAPAPGRVPDHPGPAPTYPIQRLPPTHTCLLDLAAQPLRDITATLRRKIPTLQAHVHGLRERNGRWECILSSPSAADPTPKIPASVIASNIILAIGATPRSLPFHSPFPSLHVIPLSTALDPTLLAASVTASDTVAVFGSSHSAIILIRNLLELTPVKKVINLYREPLKYALYMDNWILFDDTGLKGDTARWSRENLHGELPNRLERAFSDEKSMAHYLPLCTKVIYATGFDRREIPGGIDGLPPSHSYNAHCGIIAPGLFGCGIGYPEQRTDRYGNVEMRVGLWKFMEYLEGVIPLWKQYSVLEGIGQPKGSSRTEKKESKLFSKRQ